MSKKKKTKASHMMPEPPNIDSEIHQNYLNIKKIDIPKPKHKKKGSRSDNALVRASGGDSTMK